MKKKIGVYFFFMIFQLLEIIEKKKNSAEIVFRLLPNYIVNFYCKPCNCIARERAGKIVVKIVLQYNFQNCREEGSVYCKRC